MTDHPYEFDPSSESRSILHSQEEGLDLLHDDVLPALQAQAQSTLDAIAGARQRRADQSATRNAVRAERMQRREKGLG